MANHEGPLSEDEIQSLTERIKKEIVKEYKRKFIGVIVAIAIISAVVIFIGYGPLKDGVVQKVASTLLQDEKFKGKVADSVTNNLLPPSSKILTKMETMRLEADSLLEEMTLEHDQMLDAASREFRRTIDVLYQVRNKYSEESNQGEPK